MVYAGVNGIKYDGVKNNIAQEFVLLEMCSVSTNGEQASPAIA